MAENKEMLKYVWMAGLGLAVVYPVLALLGISVGSWMAWIIPAIAVVGGLLEKKPSVGFLLTGIILGVGYVMGFSTFAASIPIVGGIFGSLVMSVATFVTPLVIVAAFKAELTRRFKF
jgi:hypothetical protein